MSLVSGTASKRKSAKWCCHRCDIIVKAPPAPLLLPKEKRKSRGSATDSGQAAAAVTHVEAVVINPKKPRRAECLIFLFAILSTRSQSFLSFCLMLGYSEHQPHSLKITQNVAFEFSELWHFSTFYNLLKLTCLVTLLDSKLQLFKNSPKWTIFAIFE